MSEGDADGDGDTRAWLDEARDRLTSRTAIVAYAAGGTVIGAVLVLGLSWRLAGPIDTVIYLSAFLVSAGAVPLSIYLFAPSFPHSARNVMGTLHFVLGQLAWGGSLLVQRERGWELCPIRERDDRNEVLLDGSWQPFAGGDELTVLGWQPFGLLLDKTTVDLADQRADPAALTQAHRTDGGTESVAGYEVAQPDPEVSGADGTWLVDLRILFKRGLAEVGDIDVIEKVEELTIANETGSRRFGQWDEILKALIGLVLGIGTGYMVMIGF